MFDPVTEDGWMDIGSPCVSLSPLLGRSRMGVSVKGVAC